MKREEFEQYKQTLMEILGKVEYEYESFCEVLKQPRKNVRISVAVNNKMSEVLKLINDMNKNKEDYYFPLLKYFTDSLLGIIDDMKRYFPEDDQKITNFLGKLKPEVLEDLKAYNAEYEQLCNSIYDTTSIYIMIKMDQMIRDEQKSKQGGRRR